MLSRIYNYILRRNGIRKTRNELNRLSYRELEDIGIDRTMITEIAHGMNSAKV